MSDRRDSIIDRTFRAIADPTRRKILELLAVKALTVGGICEHFEISQPAISQHMRVLHEAGLAEVQVEWRHRTYHCKPERLREVLRWVRHFERFWDDALGRLDGLIEQGDDGEDS